MTTSFECSSLRGTFEAAQSSVLCGLKEKRRYKSEMSRSCRRCFLVTVEEGCQEEAPRKVAEKKRRKKGTAEGDK